MSASAPTLRRSRAGKLRAVAGWELRAATRGRAFPFVASLFALLCLVASVVGLRSLRSLGEAGIAPAAGALVNLGMLVPTLAAALAGATGLAASRERGALAMLAAQPLSRWTILGGHLLGAVASSWIVAAVGVGVAAAVLGSAGGAAVTVPLAAVLAAMLGTTASAAAIGLLLGVVSGGRAQATAAAVGAWLALAVGVDLVVAGLGVGIGPQGLLVLSLANPFEAGRILGLLATGTDGLGLGTFGLFLVDRFGTAGAVSMLAAALAVWTAGPFVAAGAVLRRGAIDR